MSLQSQIHNWLKPYCISWTYEHNGEQRTEYAVRVNTSGYRGKTVATTPPGWTDINCILKSGDHVYIEVKQQGETVRPSQDAFREQLRERGIVCFIAQSLDDVKTTFAAFGWKE